MSDTNTARDAMKAGYSASKSYIVGRRSPERPLPSALALLAAWKQVHTPGELKRSNPAEKVDALAETLGMVKVDQYSGSERWSTANDAWQSYDAFAHPTRQLGMFVIATPYGGVSRLDILGSNKQEVEELRQHLLAWGLRPRPEKV